jgi:hypothetical protein
VRGWSFGIEVVGGKLPTLRASGTEGSALNNCIAFMKSIPYGTWDQPASNTFTCRSLHSLLTPFRDVHCMHVSVDGGGKCVDHAYGFFF